MEELLMLLREWNKTHKELMSFQIFIDESGSIYSHYVGEEMEKHKWQEHFISVDDACQIMKLKIALK